MLDRSNKLKTMITKSKLEEKLNNIDESIYEDLEEVGATAPEYVPMNRPRMPLPLLMVCVLLIPTGVLSCDVTYWITSDAKICKDSHCYTQYNTLAPIKTGQEMCFNLLTGKIIRVKINRIMSVSDYSIDYYTSNWDVHAVHLAKCKGAGHCNSDGCHADYGLDSVRKEFDETYRHKWVEGLNRQIHQYQKCV